jgi:hypothetical protein
VHAQAVKTKAELDLTAIGDFGDRRRPRPLIGDCVRDQMYIFGDLNGIIDLDAEIANGAFDPMASGP